MSLWKEFKAFAMKGNVLDLAVAVIIGGAFGKIVSALVDDIIMPLVGMLTGGGKFTDNFAVLKQGSKPGPYETLAQAKAAGANVLAYGNFLQTVVDFLIIAFSIFIALRFYNKLKDKDEAEKAPPPGPTTTEKLLMEIRDELKK